MQPMFGTHKTIIHPLPRTHPSWPEDEDYDFEWKFLQSLDNPPDSSPSWKSCMTTCWPTLALLASFAVVLVVVTVVVTQPSGKSCWNWMTDHSSTSTTIGTSQPPSDQRPSPLHSSSIPDPSYRHQITTLQNQRSDSRILFALLWFGALTAGWGIICGWELLAHLNSTRRCPSSSPWSYFWSWLRWRDCGAGIGWERGGHVTLLLVNWSMFMGLVAMKVVLIPASNPRPLFPPAPWISLNMRPWSSSSSNQRTTIASLPAIAGAEKGWRQSLLRPITQWVLEGSRQPELQLQIQQREERKNWAFRKREGQGGQGRVEVVATEKEEEV